MLLQGCGGLCKRSSGWRREKGGSWREKEREAERQKGRGGVGVSSRQRGRHEELSSRSHLWALIVNMYTHFYVCHDSFLCCAMTRLYVSCLLGMCIRQHTHAPMQLWHIESIEHHIFVKVTKTGKRKLLLALSYVYKCIYIQISMCTRDVYTLTILKCIYVHVHLYVNIHAYAMYIPVRYLIYTYAIYIPSRYLKKPPAQFLRPDSTTPDGTNLFWCRYMCTYVSA